MVTASTALSVAALVAGVTLMLIVHVLVIFWALRRGTAQASGADLERAVDHACGGKGKGLSSAEIETLPCHDFKAAVGGGGDCAVCLEAFESGDRCRRLPRCEHSFHAPCVDSWLKKSQCCPVCRADVVDRPTAEAKVAGEGEAPALTVEMAERTNPAALEVVVERLQRYSWGPHAVTVLL
ncbi:E3 ubiquitin-protein ligase ATL41-like [Aegilops tauschii subsp. strangulata]|uniref:RING-type domain-containing protein n=2 Tax=Triticinae TaxID=1648030 RepID=A0A453RBM5_AEGTS|nr:E3 ubiquitin-protein ligase ATL23-like [Aegilops tauschii subsp. strangulata]XP_044444627.1 E3 ubiquitin-protein ligase ATL23-like [Triticum aestivum]